MTIALIVAGFALGVLSLRDTFLAGQDRDEWQGFVGLSFGIAACTCFYIAGTMAGAQ